MMEYILDLGGGILSQIANRSRTQMMSYIIDCPEGGTIVIDGGMYCKEDADELYRQIEARGKRVDLWFFTHCHMDHYGAWLKLMEEGHFDFDVKALCFCFPDKAWMLTKEDREYTEKFYAALKTYSRPVVTPRAGDVFFCGGISVEVLNEPIAYENYPSINPTSIILRMNFPKKSVLFLGDFDRWAEKDYREHFSIEKLRCDIVQMAHHGQGGVSREFYAHIAPKYCLYPTPAWLWENNTRSFGSPETRGQGIFRTMETRLWMAELRVVESFHMGYGDWVFR